MFDLRTLDQDQLTVMQKAYVIVDALAERARHVDFGGTIEQAEDSHLFQEALSRVAEAGDKPEEFVALHALAQCGMQIRGMQLESLENFLFDATEKLLGLEIKARLREWMDNRQIAAFNQLPSAASWQPR